MFGCPLCGENFDSVHGVEGHISVKQDKDHEGYVGADLREEISAGETVESEGVGFEGEGAEGSKVSPGTGVESFDDFMEMMESKEELEEALREDSRSKATEVLEQTGDPKTALAVSFAERIDESEWSWEEVALFGGAGFGLAEATGITQLTPFSGFLDGMDERGRM